MIIDPDMYGVSFSLKQCRNFDQSPKRVLRWLLSRGWRRFRLMTYWSWHESEQGKYDFRQLDWQLDMIEQAGGVVTLCLGVKQPRWPEYHWPKWTSSLSETERDKALMDFIAATVNHVKNRQVITSYQLENEALLRVFGEKINIDRPRLRRELALVRRLDPKKPIYMSTSDSWGLPLRRPKPDGYGFSLYTVMHHRGRSYPTLQFGWWHRLRAWFIKKLLKRPVFIHELQCEPWHNRPIWRLDTTEQDDFMPLDRLASNIKLAKTIATPVDLWGAEWWYDRWQRSDKHIWQTIEANLE